MKKIITLGIMLSSMMMFFSGCSKLELKDKEAVATVSETEGVATTEVATEDEVTTESAAEALENIVQNGQIRK